jgi:large subunit ribosomal protein L25
MTISTLVAAKRTVTGKQVGQLRRDGQLPAVLYGPGTEPLAIQLNAKEAGQTIRKIKGTQLVDLIVDGKPYKALVQELQRDSIRGTLLHADFYAVDMSRVLRVRVPLHLTGTSYAVVSLSGVLVHGVTEIEIECLPADLPTGLDMDLDALKEIGSALHVSDVPVPAGVKVLTNPEELVARVTYQAKEEDLSAAVAAVTPTEVEVIEKGKLEEEGEAEAVAGAKPAAAKPAAAKPAAAKPAAKK